MKATADQRQTARDLLNQIKKETKGFEAGIEDAVLDDWNDHGSFQAAVVLKTKGRRKPYRVQTNLRRLTPAIKRSAQKFENVCLSEIDHPGRVTEWNSAAQKSESRGHASTTTIIHFTVPRSVSQAES